MPINTYFNRNITIDMAFFQIKKNDRLLVLDSTRFLYALHYIAVGLLFAKFFAQTCFFPIFTTQIQGLSGSIRKIGALFFLGIFFFNAVLYYACTALLDLRVKADMAYMVRHNSKSAVEFDMPANQLSLYSKGEFLKDGSLYDIVSVTQSGAMVRIFAVKDTREGSLINKIINHVSNEHNLKGGKATHPAKGFSKIIGQDYVSQDKIAITAVSYLHNNKFHIVGEVQPAVAVPLFSPPPEPASA